MGGQEFLLSHKDCVKAVVVTEKKSSTYNMKKNSQTTRASFMSKLTLQKFADWRQTHLSTQYFRC